MRRTLRGLNDKSRSRPVYDHVRKVQGHVAVAQVVHVTVSFNVQMPVVRLSVPKARSG